jgi:hypothetical protein
LNLSKLIFRIAGKVSLQPGYAYKLDRDSGDWVVKPVPQEVISISKEIGHLVIRGEETVVFETPDGDQWAMKNIAGHTDVEVD